MLFRVERRLNCPRFTVNPFSKYNTEEENANDVTSESPTRHTGQAGNTRVYELLLCKAWSLRWIRSRMEVEYLLTQVYNVVTHYLCRETLPKDIIIRSFSSEPFRSLLIILGYYFHKLLIRWKSNHKIDKIFLTVNFYFPKRSASLWTIRWNVNHDANSASMETKKWAHDTKKRCESAGGSDASEISLA